MKRRSQRRSGPESPVKSAQDATGATGRPRRQPGLVQFLARRLGPNSVEDLLREGPRHHRHD